MSYKAAKLTDELVQGFTWGSTWFVSWKSSADVPNTQALQDVWPLLKLEDVKTISHCIVKARLDYCNSLQHGTFAGSLHRLHIAQNKLGQGRLWFAGNLWHCKIGFPFLICTWNNILTGVVVYIQCIHYSGRTWNVYLRQVMMHIGHRRSVRLWRHVTHPTATTLTAVAGERLILCTVLMSLLIVLYNSLRMFLIWFD